MALSHDVPGPHEPAARHRIPTRLKPADRCDGCGAQAYAAAEIAGVDLYFCGHHFSRSEEQIRGLAAEVLDERWTLQLLGLREPEPEEAKKK